MENKIQFNAAIYPKVMSIIIGKPYNKNENDSDEMVLELVVDLPRSAYLIYLQKIFDEHVEPEIDLFKKYAYGVVLDDSDYMTLLSFIMTTTQRNWNKSINSGDLLAPFGLCMKVDDAGKRNLELLEETKDSIRVEAWEGIIIDLLSKSSMDIISCFDFDEHFERQAENSINDKLYISLGAWKYTPDTAEQNLSNALRAAFMFTLVGYYSGDRKNQYSSFVDYFEAEFYKRVSLVYGMWVSLEDKTKIKYLPLYDSFYNLTSSSKNIIQDFDLKPRLMDGNGNAILVADSIYTACKYYEIFQQRGFKKCAIISSYTPQAGGFRGDSIKERRIKRALFAILNDDTEVERLYKIIEKQEEY